MARSMRTTAVVVATGALALGAGVGVASLASAADPTTTPSASPSASASTSTTLPQAPGDHRGGPRGQHGEELAKTLAAKLGLSQTKVADALSAVRQSERSTTTRPTTGSRPDPAARDAALAKALAPKLGVSEAKVKTALDAVRATAQADRAAALKTRLDAAVKAGTLTQAEADAVTKAVEKGVIGGGPR